MGELLSSNDVHGGYSLVAAWVLLSSCAEVAPVLFVVGGSTQVVAGGSSLFAAEVILCRCDVWGIPL